jgi:hypothetical protein
MAGFLSRLLRVLLVGGMVLLTGCIQYDLDLQFDSQTHGQIVQRLHWSNGGAVSAAQLQAWQSPLGDRVRQVGGQLRQVDPLTLEVTVPFHNGADFVDRFNRFFGGDAVHEPLTLPTGDTLAATATLSQGNWIVALFNRLSLTVDLRALPDGEALPGARLQSVQWWTGAIALSTPWGLRGVTASPGALPGPPLGTTEEEARGQWALVPGQVNHLEVTFWLPSPIGIGLLGIGGLVAIGYGLRYRLGVGRV